MKKKILAATSLVLGGLLAGCGGSGSSAVSPASTTGGTTTTAISGKVADGYLAGATVFMDKNGNYQFDPGEPSATTAADGSYTLNVDPADVGKYPILAIVTKGVTIDMDNGQTVADSYLLSMPKDAVSGTVSSNFISPISTEVTEMMATGKYATMQDAMAALRVKMGLPSGTNMLGDYVAGQNSSMHTQAQNMASLMGSQMSAVMSGSGSSTTVDVNRYRGMMGSIFSNISSVRSAGANTQSTMTTLMGSMSTGLQNITAGQPFRNMSASFRGMMGGSTSTGSGMMGGSTGSTGTGSCGSMM